MTTQSDCRGHRRRFAERYAGSDAAGSVWYCGGGENKSRKTESASCRSCITRHALRPLHSLTGHGRACVYGKPGPALAMPHGQCAGERRGWSRRPLDRQLCEASSAISRLPALIPLQFTLLRGARCASNVEVNFYAQANARS